MIIILFILAFFINCGFQQTNAQVIERDAKYFVSGGNEISLNSDEIRIDRQGENIYRNKLRGIKSYTTSPGNNYLLISNYAFNEASPRFDITHFIFNDQAVLINELKLDSESDMPHPLFKIDNDGTVFSFDPLLLKIIKYQGQESSEIQLEKDVPFEMERAFYLQVHKGNIYILVSIEPLEINSNRHNAALYKVELKNISINKTIINLSVPSLLFVDDEGIYVSGVKFNNSVPAGSTFKLNSSLITVSSNDLNIKKMIPFADGYFGSTGNSIVKINKDISAAGNYSADGGERFEDIALAGRVLIALLMDEKTCSVITLDENLKLVNRVELNINGIFDFASISSNEDNLIIHTRDKTYIVK